MKAIAGRLSVPGASISGEISKDFPEDYLLWVKAQTLVGPARAWRPLG